MITDGERLRTALVNILSNAREAVAARAGGGEAGVPVRPDVSCHAAADGRVAIVVADRGIGIAAADLPHVFEPYFTTKRTGTGLGLAIAKNIVDALGGAITARSQPGRGHRDAHRAAARGARRRWSSLMAPRGTILLVDDEEKILKALGRALREEGHEVRDHHRARGRRSACWASAPSTCWWSTTDARAHAAWS